MTYYTAIEDTFTRADGSLGSPETDAISYGAWVDNNGATTLLPTIVSNVAVNAAGSGTKIASIRDGVNADHRVTIGTEVGKGFTLYLRADLPSREPGLDDATYITVTVNATGVVVAEFVLGSSTSLGTQNWTASAGDPVELVVTLSGSAVTVTSDDLTTISVTTTVLEAGELVVTFPNTGSAAPGYVTDLLIENATLVHDLDTTELPQYMLHAFPNGEDEVATIVPHCAVERFEHRRNAPGEAVVSFALDTPFLGAFTNADDEWETGVRCWIVRDGQIVWRGFTDGYDPDTSRGIVRIRLMDDLEHYARQLAGDAERNNYADGWAAETWTEEGDATYTTTTTATYTADGATAFVVDGGTDGGYLEFAFPVDDSSAANQQVYHSSVWMYVDPGDEWPFTITAQLRWDGGGAGKFVNGKATWDEYDTDATGRLVRLEVEPLTVPAAQTDVEYVVYLHARPSTTVYYSALQIARNDNVGVGKGGDVGTLVGTLLQYAIDQDPNYLPISRRSQLTGVTLTEGMIYPHSEHPELWSCISDWFHEVEIRMHHGRGRVESGPSIGRTFTQLQVGPIDGGGHYGGAVQPSAVNGRDRSTQVIALGAARDTVTRDERAAVGTGPRWMSVISAPDGTLPKDLTAIATGELEALEDPGGVTTVQLRTPYGHRTPGDWLRFDLTACDKFTTRIDAGPSVTSGTMTVDRLTVFPTDGDRCEVDLVKS